MFIRKKILMFLLGGTMVLGSLVGCGADSAETAETRSETSQQTEADQDMVEEIIPEGPEGENPETVSSSVEMVPEKTEEEMLQLQQVKTIEDGDYLRLRKTYFGNNFDPQSMNWPEVYTACYEGLYSSVQQNGVTYYRTAGAENVKVSGDGLTVTFYLRRDAKWSDKVPVTAGDYEYAWKHLLNPALKFKYADLLDNVEGAKAYRTKAGEIEAVGIHALDAYTLEVRLNSPDPDFYKKTISPALYPIRQDILEQDNEIGRWGENWSNCVFNGPYKVLDFESLHYILLERNEYYWDQIDVLSEKVLWYLQVNDEMAMDLFANQHLDVLNLYSADAQGLEEQAAQGAISRMSVSLPELSYLSFNFNGPAANLDLRRLRQVLSLSLDREALAEQTGELPAYGLVPTPYTVGSLAYRILREEPLRSVLAGYAENPSEYEALVESTIGSDPSALHLIILNYETGAKEQKILSLVQSQWQEKLGISVEIRTAETYAEFLEARNAGEYDLIFTSYSQAYDDIDDYLSAFISGKSANNGSYDSQNYTNLVNQAAGIIDDQAKSDVILQAETDLISDNAYLIPLLYGTEVLYYSNDLSGLMANPFSANPDTMYVDYTARFNVEEPVEETDGEPEEETEEEEKKGLSLFQGWGKDK